MAALGQNAGIIIACSAFIECERDILRIDRTALRQNAGITIACSAFIECEGDIFRIDRTDLRLYAVDR